ncbi:MAG: hypothetical protein ACQ9MH_01905 [Nitrospinales bacterium]
MSRNLSIGFLTILLSVFIFPQLHFAQVSLAGGGEKTIPNIPALNETIKIALNHNSNKPKHEIIYSVKENYYLIQLKNDQLKISNEVKGHFETAIEKAEEKMESDEADITQSQITKLKLGLAGAKGDIIKYTSASLKARLKLGRLMGVDLHPDAELDEHNLIQIKTQYKTLEEYLKLTNKNSSEIEKSGDPGQLKPRISEEKMHLLKEAFITLNEKKGFTNLARKNRRMTRALLVTEVANYDFGLGSGGDLFEALIIYTKLLNGFYQSVYGYNIGVAELDKIYSE